jgi:hypothetical protein
MVSHFDEIDVVVITEGFAADRSNEELDNIEEQVPSLRLVNPESCLKGGWIGGNWNL